jgi:hypothetical protein
LFGDTQAHFDEDIKPLVEGIMKAGPPALYEGLPHQRFERKLLERELTDKETVKLHGFPFYAEAIPPKAEHVKELTAIFSKAGTFSPYAMHWCGEFHPDWCLEWKSGGEVNRALVCFGCDEAMLFGPRRQLRVNITEATKADLKRRLGSYWSLRPVSLPRKIRRDGPKRAAPSSLDSAAWRRSVERRSSRLARPATGSP